MCAINIKVLCRKDKPYVLSCRILSILDYSSPNEKFLLKSLAPLISNVPSES